MGRTRPPAWEQFTEPAEKETVKAGLTVTLHGWTCKFCGASFWNTNLARMLGHVSCEQSLCDCIEPCSESKVPEEERLDAKAQLEARNGVASAKKKRAVQVGRDDETMRG